MSVPFLARDVCAWTGGELVRGRPEARFAGVSIDTRSLEPGALFAAIVGPRFDAHDFLAGALAAGAAGLLVARGRALPADLKPDVPVVAVADTTRALGDLACGHRSGFDGPLVAITGSNGKTSTKEMCAAILSVSAPCLKSVGNLNNEFGLPLTLLRRDASHRSAVVELGMNHRGEIARLAAIARPTIGVITNVGQAHIEHLGSREEIALEKGDLVAALPADGTAVLNADDPRVATQAARTRARVVRFGMGEDADVRPLHVERSGRRGFAFELATPQGAVAVEISGLAETTLWNALAAAAAALAAGATRADVAAGLAAVRPVNGRLAPRDLPGGIVLIDDTYNASPQSMELALRLLAERRGAGRGLAVLGSMGELGPGAERAHREAGRLAAELRLDFVFALGEHAEALAEGALAAGMPRSRVRVGRDHDELAARVAEELASGDWVLVKGSRAMHMERVVEALSRREVR
jgi:UDP-N-acetylmuramoyl-tripeptide--D-alanyl-D-alanine ligase